MEKGISIIVCCYNSSKRIKETLEHLARLKVNSSVELLLVDNNCNDQTVDIAIKTWENNGEPYPLSILKESQPGLSYARKCGVSASKYDLILFCDDDNHLAENYLEVGEKFMRANPSVGACFGNAKPYFEKEAPEWIFPFLESYAIGPNSLESGIVNPPRVPWGAGLWMPAQFLHSVWPDKKASILADRTGKSLSSGGDTELCYWAKEAGYTWYYLSELQFKHVVPAERMNKNYLRELHQKFGEADFLIAHYYNPSQLKKIPINTKRYLSREKIYLKLIRYIWAPYYSFDKELSRRRFYGYVLSSLKVPPTNAPNANKHSL